MKLALLPLVLLSTLLALPSCSAAPDEGYGTLDEAVLGKDTFLYFRCNATGWQPTPVTRLVPSTTEPGVFTLSYNVTQFWMVSNQDQCTFTETNAKDAWGTWQDYYGADVGNPMVVPKTGKIRVTGSDYFNVKYPKLGKYTIKVSWPSGVFTIAAAGTAPPPPPPCSPKPEVCNGVDDDCDGKVDESYLCKPAATAAAIDELLTKCPSAAVLDAIDQDFDIRFEFMDTNADGVVDDPAPKGNTLVCTKAQGSRDLTQTKERTYQALIALRALQLNQAPPFTTKTNLYEWMHDSIKGIRLRTDISTSFCCEPPPDTTGNYISILNGPNRSVYSTDLWVTEFGLGMHSLVQLMVHETRHANGPLHTCPDGARDNTIAELGAWGSVYYFDRALAFNSDPCFLRPTLAASDLYPGQMFGNDAYLVQMRHEADMVQTSEFCAETSVPANPPDPVTACSR